MAHLTDQSDDSRAAVQAIHQQGESSTPQWREPSPLEGPRDRWRIPHRSQSTQQIGGKRRYPYRPHRSEWTKLALAVA